jgi:hypothetical protein
MKFMSTFLLCVISCGAFAGWAPITACQTNVLDMAWKNSSPAYYQMVVRDPNILNQFITLGAIAKTDVNERGEFVLELDYSGNNEFYFETENRKYYVWMKNSEMLLEARNGEGQRITDWVFRSCEVIDRGYRHGDCGHPQPYRVSFSETPGPWFYVTGSGTPPGRFNPQFDTRWQVHYNFRNQVVGCFDDGCCQ